ncbi:MAG: prepilin-type N-terminal cleavage/methylation domain-containing protein [Lachnospiraceae bacterium]|nr:prepilin-type N-terminal cleavage/methylation domain-containing protein [Lachnospiraceae bacterium]
MIKNKNGRKLNNKGMSLIEILVAVIILAIVSGPLLHALVTSIKLNTKAKENQSVNTMGQSIMEGLKAYDMEQLCRQFNGGSMRLISGEQISTDVLNLTSWYEVGASDRNGDGVIDAEVSIDPANGTFLPAPDGKYEFVLTNVKCEGIYNDKYYDIKIDISPKTGWHAALDMENINEYLDAVYRQSMNMDQAVYSQIMSSILDEFTEQFNAGAEHEETFDLHDLESMQDSLTVDKVVTVEVKEESGANIVTITTQYNYTAKYKYTDDDGSLRNFTISGTKYVDESASPVVCVDASDPNRPSTTVYDNTDAEVEGVRPQLENVYLYYYPAYSISGVDIHSETINLVNNTSAKNFYLVKQINNNLSNAKLSNCESDYAPKVTVTASGPITLYHNLQENLANPGGPPLTTLWVPASASAGGIIADMQEVFLLYDVKVSIYKPGAASGNVFPEDMRLLELTGSMND